MAFSVCMLFGYLLETLVGRKDHIEVRCIVYFKWYPYLFLPGAAVRRWYYSCI